MKHNLDDIILNKIYNEDCIETMKRIPDNYVDLTITSPPYDNLRTYKDNIGLQWNFETFMPIADSLYRITKDGGVVVWIVGDETINGDETGSSFKQALYFKEIGFKLHDTMIWNKGNFTAVGSLKTRYAPVFEYMFVFTKGKIKTFNPIKDRKNKHAGTFQHGTVVQRDGTKKRVSTHNKKKFSEYGQRHNIWEIIPCKQKIKHSARFPEQLAYDHIISWSNEGDLIYDPFMGSGTLAKMALKTKRNFIGSEISKEYYEIAMNRIESLLNNSVKIKEFFGE